MRLVRLLLLGLLLLPGLAMAQNISPDEQLRDQARLLQDQASLRAVLDELRTQTGVRLWLYTVRQLPGDEPADLAAAQLLQTLEPDGQGMLILVVADKRLVLIQSGAKLNLPRARVNDIQQRIIIPRLREGQHEQGLLQGARALAHLVADPLGIALNFPTVKMEPATRWWQKVPLEPKHLWLPGLILLWYVIMKLRKRKKING